MTTASTSPARADDDETEPGIEEAIPSNALSMGLQLSRASTMAMLRLQLALESGERRQALEAIDRLHALDAEMERLVNQLPLPGDDADLRAITRHVGDQKVQLAFDKLALASGISGPDMNSGDTPMPPRPAEEPPSTPMLAALADTDEPPSRRSLPDWLIPLLLALAATAALAVAILFMTT